MSAAEKWNKAERLAVAGALAPRLRSLPADVKARRVGRLDADGKIVGYTTLGKVQESLLAAREIEIEMADGVRPTEVICIYCPKTIKVPSHGAIPKCCAGRGGCHNQKRCAGYGDIEGKCKRKPSKNAFRHDVIIRRNGEPWMCPSCSGKKRCETKEWQERHSKETSKRWDDPEYKRKNAERLRKLAKDPKWRESVSKRLKERFKDPKMRAKAAAGANRRWSDPAERERASKTQQRIAAERPEHEKRRHAEKSREALNKARVARWGRKPSQTGGGAGG